MVKFVKYHFHILNKSIFTSPSIFIMVKSAPSNLVYLPISDDRESNFVVVTYAQQPFLVCAYGGSSATKINKCNRN